jgi:hypothetical protein
MEQEFYQLEPFRGDLQRFLNQAWTYQLWFNYLRENSAKGHRTPDQLRAERAPWVHAKVYALPPVLLSSLSAQDLPSPRQILGQDLPGHCHCVVRPQPPTPLIRARTAAQRRAAVAERRVKKSTTGSSIASVPFPVFKTTPPRPLVRTTQGFPRANGGRLLPPLSVTS